MSRILLYISSSIICTFFVLVSVATFAQSSFLPSAVRVGTDLTLITKSIIQRNFYQYEFHADIDSGPLFLTSDYGFGYINRSDASLLYDIEHRAHYFRLGVDYDILSSDPNNVIFVGARFGQSFFDDTLLGEIKDEYWGNSTLEKINNNSVARWAELNLGMKVRVWKQLYLGYTLRYKFWRYIVYNTSYVPYDIMGFGTTARKGAFAINYHIYYRIPFRNKTQ